MLRAILEISFTPDDNDLFLSNLIHTPILAIHGYAPFSGSSIRFTKQTYRRGNDENVPTWHTREYSSVIKTWDSNADIEYVASPSSISELTSYLDTGKSLDGVTGILPFSTMNESSSFLILIQETNRILHIVPGVSR